MYLRVMLVDDRPERREIIARALREVDCGVVACVSPDQDLLGPIREHNPDVVLIDMDSPGRDTLENLHAVKSTAPRPMVMFTQNDDGETIRRAVEAGVSAYVVDGLQHKRVRPIIDAAIARFRQYRALEDELAQVRTQLQERKLVERAKGILMRQRGVSEEEAYRLLRKAAMDRNKRLGDIAESIIAAAELLGGAA
ncbi:MAG: ANTAR domain-containing protein [Chromatiales bacterium]|jgi:response regulator NasT